MHAGMDGLSDGLTLLLPAVKAALETEMAGVGPCDNAYLYLYIYIYTYTYT